VQRKFKEGAEVSYVVDRAESFPEMRTVYRWIAAEKVVDEPADSICFRSIRPVQILEMRQQCGAPPTRAR
jgi:hypothetical protein